MHPVVPLLLIFWLSKDSQPVGSDWLRISTLPFGPANNCRENELIVAVVVLELPILKSNVKVLVVVSKVRVAVELRLLASGSDPGTVCMLSAKQDIAENTTANVKSLKVFISSDVLQCGPMS